MTYDAIKKGDSIRNLAAYFWEKITDIHGMPVKVDLRDFVSWLGIHVVFPNTSSDDSADIETLEKINSPLLVTRPEHQDFDPELIENWAQNFARKLPEKDRMIFYLRYHEDLGFVEIAKQTGYKGASGPKERLKIIEQQLRSFLSPLPWLSPDVGDISGDTNFNETAFQLFLEILNKNLKISIKMP